MFHRKQIFIFIFCSILLFFSSFIYCYSLTILSNEEKKEGEIIILPIISDKLNELKNDSGIFRVKISTFHPILKVLVNTKDQKISKLRSTTLQIPFLLERRDTHNTR